MMIVGSGGRRRWTVSEKRLIVAEALAPDVRIADVARKYALNLRQLYTWCGAYRDFRPANAGAIVPIEVREEVLATSAELVTILTPSGLRVEAPLSADEASLCRLFAALRACG
jgi:transposase-like protein